MREQQPEAQPRGPLAVGRGAGWEVARAARRAGIVRNGTGDTLVRSLKLGLYG